MPVHGIGPARVRIEILDRKGKKATWLLSKNSSTRENEETTDKWVAWTGTAMTKLDKNRQEEKRIQRF